MNVRKRDGTICRFDGDKIKSAILRASQNHPEVECAAIDEVVAKITSNVRSLNRDPVNIEQIQDIVEKTLMKDVVYEVAKQYILYRKERENSRKHRSFASKITKDTIVPWGPIGYVTYKRTYARKKEDRSTEEFKDTVLRVLNSCQNDLGCNFTNHELEEAYDFMMNLKFSVAGRFLWQLGTSTVSKLGLPSLQNCAFVKIDDPIKPFLWIFDMLMLGTGIGVSIQRKNVNKLPPITSNSVDVHRLATKAADFIVPDSR